MALFGSKKNKEEKAKKAEKVEKTEAVEVDVEKEVSAKTVKTNKPKRYIRKPKANTNRSKGASNKTTKAKATNPTRDLSSIIVRPRITEKGAILASEANTYVFDVAKTATKSEIKSAIAQIYKVTPEKVTTAKVPSKSVRVRGARRKTGVKTGGKKAYIYLKKGDKIDFV